jgi:hypothetical protein
MANTTTTTPSLSPTLALILGAIITVSIGIFSYLSHNFSVPAFEAFIAAYGVSGTALGVYLITEGGGGPSWLKWIVLIIASSVGYGLSIFLNNDLISIASLAAFVVALASFALDEIQKYAPELPPQIVNDGTLIIGGVVVIATAISNIPAGTTQTVQVILSTAISALFVYIIQVYTPGATPTPLPIPSPPPVPTSTPAGTGGAPKVG